jgi:endo-1,4-beta-mannosidase
MLSSDVDMKDTKGLPTGCYPADWTREQKILTCEDSLTWDMWLRIYKEQTTFIKGIDPNHLVTSGDAGTRPECTSRRETFPDFKYRKDTLRESIANNLASQPELLDVFSYHVYGSNADPDATLNWMRWISRATHAAQVPVFIGELGQWEPTFDKDPQGKWTRQAIDVYDVPGSYSNVEIIARDMAAVDTQCGVISQRLVQLEKQ